MLAAIALAVARNARQWTAAFAIAFGVWDIVFYACLKLLLGWPASLFTWDILFLIPVPWVGPVIAPVLVSLTMIAAGILVSMAGSGQRTLENWPLEHCWCPAGSTGDRFVFHAGLSEHHGGRDAEPIPLGRVWSGDGDRRCELPAGGVAEEPFYRHTQIMTAALSGPNLHAQLATDICP
jgi:hypothetical protein